MSNRIALAPVGASGMNSRTSIGPARAVPRKSVAPANAGGSAGGSQIPTSATGRKSLGGKEDPKLDSRRSMIPTGPGQPRVSLSTNQRAGMPRQSLNARSSLSNNRRTSRTSMNPSGGRESLGRRTSLFGAVGDGQIAKDPRPIKERPYIIQCVQRVEQFLVEHQYEKPLSQQQLMCPSSKDFFYMLEFLLRRIDPNFAFKDAKKPEEETPALFKALKYPFGMSARSLSSVGTPHAWPNFLAALHWFIEMLTYHELAQEYRMAIFEEDATSAEAVSHSFFEFVAESYSAFMSFDERENQLETEFVRAMLDRNREREEHTFRLKEHTSQILAETERLANQDTRIVKLTETVNAAQAEMEALKAEVKRIQEENENRAAQLNEMKAKGNAQREMQAQLEKDLASIDRVLRLQTERGLDADKLKTSTQEVKQAIITATNRRDEVEQASSLLEMEISEKFREVERGTSALNALLESTELVKQLGAEIRVQPQHPSNILSMDMKATVKPLLLKFLEEQRAQHQANQPLLVEMQAKAESKKEEVNLRRANLADLKSRLDRETASFNGLKDTFVQPRKQIEQSILEIENEIAQIALSSKGSLSSRKKDQLDLAQKIDSLKLSYEKVETELCDQLALYVDWFVEHKEYISDVFQSLLTDLDKQSSSLDSN